MKKNVLPMMAAVACFAISAVAQAQQYDYESVDYPGASATSLFGVNDRGDAVGNADAGAGNLPFFYDTRKGAITDIASIAGFTTTSVIGISDSGDATGSVFDEMTLVESGLILDKNGSATIFDHPDAVGLTQARAINNQGVVTGFRNDAEPLVFGVGFIYDPRTETFIDLIPSLRTIAQGINNRGEVVGDAIFLPGNDPCDSGFPGTTRYGWLRTTDGNITYFSVNGLRTSARAITDSGTVGGFGFDPFTGKARGFVTELDGTQCQQITIPEEELLEFPGAFATFVQGITNSGKITGAWTDEIGLIGGGFVATPQ